MGKKKRRRGPQAAEGGEREELPGGLGPVAVGKKIESLKVVEASEAGRGAQSKGSEMLEVKEEESSRDFEVSGGGSRKGGSWGKNVVEHAAEATEEEGNEVTEGGKKKRSNRRSNMEDAAEATKGREGGAKRSRESGPEPSGKDDATAVADGGASNKKSFERLWSEDSEIKLLKGIIECQEENGVEAGSAIDLIHKHVHETLHMEFSRSQLYEKIRRLRQKFQSAISRTKGSNPASVKPHDQALFELSMKIWTTEKVTKPVVVVENGAGRNNEEVRAGPLYPNLREAISHLEKEGKYYMGGGFGLLKEGFQLLKPSKAKKLEERCKANYLAGMKFLLENSKLEEELLQACVEALER